MHERTATDLRAQREAAGVKPGDLARHLGVSRWTVWRWEKEPERVPVYRVADFLRGVHELAERPAA